MIAVTPDTPPAPRSRRAPGRALPGLRRAATVVLLTALAVAGCAGPHKPRPAYACTAGRVDAERAAREAFGRINRLRESAGLPALVWEDALADIARRYSRELADADRGLTHAGFTRRRDAAAARLTITRVAENLALSCGDTSTAARLAVDGWQESPAHLDRILDGFQISAIGVAQSRSGYLYFTQLLAARLRAP